MDAKTLPIGFRPVYESYVDHVIAHLGGKGFRETAEEELIARLHKVLMPYSRDNFKAELKGDKIVIPNILCFSKYSWDNTLQLTGSSERDLNDLCAGIIFSMTESLNGGINYLVGFDRENVDVSRWYNLISGPVSVKLFKNCRLDVKFKDAGAAGRCWKNLRLDTLEAPTGDE